jgi:hypothetical protein
VGRHGDRDEPPEEHGKLIHFPGSGRVPDEASSSEPIEPPGEAADPSGRETGTFDAIDFWGNPHQSAATGNPEESTAAGSSKRSARKAVLPLVVLLAIGAVSGGTAAAVVALTSGLAHKARSQAHLSDVSHRVHRSTLWIARSVTPKPPKHRAGAHRRRPRKHTALVSSVSHNTTPLVATAPPSTSVPSYNAPTSGNTSAGGSSSSSRTPPGPTGRVSLIGAGTTPSG